MLTPSEIRAAKELAEKATPGPWCSESCGEKGDGANMIGVAYGPGDDKCEHPLRGWLKPFDDDGNEIEYYRDEEVAVCQHVNRNSGYDAQFIAASRTLIPALCDTALAAIAERDAALAVVNEQANDAGLWFVPQTVTEDYLQRALRRLHEAVEGKSAAICAIDALLKDKAVQSWYCDRCAVEVYQVRCPHCGKTQRERK